MISHVPIDYVSYKSQKSQTQVFCLIWTSVACAVDPGVNPLQNRKLNMWTLFYNVCIDFFNSQIWKEIMLELNGKPSSVTTFSTDFPSKTWFFGIYLNFQQQKSLLNQYLAHSKSKSYQINFIKSFSSRSFQQYKTHIPIPLNFLATIYSNFQWRNHSIFKNFCTAGPNVMKPSPCTSPHR